MNRTFVYARDGRVFEKGSPEYAAYRREQTPLAPMIAKDEGEFVSPIDGKVYSGRAGMKEHNRRHDVVNWRDLQGLPIGVPKVQPDSREIKAAIVDAARRKGYL